MYENIIINGVEYEATWTYDSYGGGTNNLDIVSFRQKGKSVCMGFIATGTSLRGKQAARSNAIRNLKHKLA